MTTTTTAAKITEWKIYIGEIIIGIIGIVAFLKNGDGATLTAVIAAESALAGVAIGSA